MHNALASLKLLIDSIQPLSNEDWEAFANHWQPFSAKRKEILTAIGGQEKYLYFIIEGVQRICYFDDLQREATLVFTYGPSFGGVLDALLLQRPSRYSYETLTASTFIRISHHDLQALMQTRPAIESLIRQGITEALSGILERLVELQCFNTEERFRRLLKRSPHILQLVPHKYLANYIGMDATNFSKLINKVRMD